ncbi:unnamed protein product [Rhizoctonia solani]|uniref:Multiple myeloma tumor-associated protein 2-like N-terminal domain-containing protein n=1 Tax=Rhizoctonia solani TaxID=456999 RepID=A0A8H3AMQ7_9AGAM|nr:unnamed protein product [Rhizoctonia solani]
MYEPTRGGTRGGQAEFKWSDVSADKDRENYLGHSINAPTGRWQKNKDVHWYNRDLKSTSDERAEEIKKIKEAEAEAMAIALGYKPAPKPGASTTGGPATGANAAPVTGANATSSSAEAQPASGVGHGASDKEKIIEEEIEKARKALEKQEKRERKEQRRAEKELKRATRKEDKDKSRPRERSRNIEIGIWITDSRTGVQLLPQPRTVGRVEKTIHHDEAALPIIDDTKTTDVIDKNRQDNP